MATISTEFDESDDIEMAKNTSKTDDEKYVNIRLSLEGLDELCVILLKDQREDILKDIENRVGGEDLIWAFDLILAYNLSDQDYEKYMAENS